VNARKVLEYKPDPNKFDLVVQRWDGQGQKIAENHYRKFITADGEMYERPVNSGNLWLANNQPAGRVICEFNDKGHIVSKVFDPTAKHTVYSPAPTGAEKLSGELAAERAKNAQLEAELRAITKDREDAAVETVKEAPKNYAPKLTKRE
jgi:hypothetical protein